MQRFTQPTPDGRTIPADPSPRRHVEHPPDSGPETGSDRAPEHEAAPAAFSTFVAGSIAALPQLPRDSGSRLCLQLFLLGAAESLNSRRQLTDGAGFSRACAALLERHGLPGSETLALIEALPELRRDPQARRIIRQGADAMTEWLGARDRGTALRIGELLAQWQRTAVCRGSGGG